MPNHSTRVYEDVFEMLPDEDNPSPLVRVNRLNPRPEFALYAKLEWMNPFGSVKDRAAWAMLRDLEERGEIGGGRGIVEPTSGNTGISLAAMAAVRGYPMLAVIPERVPEEKKALLRIAGADVEALSDALCPVPGQGGGTINMAKTHAKAQRERFVLPNQYENERNVEAHVRTTGPEIWRQSEGRVTHVFCSLGTCGTVTGISRYLKAQNPKVRIVAVQPTEGHDVPGLRNVSELAVTRLYDPAGHRRDPRGRLRDGLQARARPREDRRAVRGAELRPRAGGRGPLPRRARGGGTRIRRDDLRRQRLQVRVEHAQAHP